MPALAEVGSVAIALALSAFAGLYPAERGAARSGEALPSV